MTNRLIKYTVLPLLTFLLTFGLFLAPLAHADPEPPCSSQADHGNTKTGPDGRLLVCDCRNNYCTWIQATWGNNSTLSGLYGTGTLTTDLTFVSAEPGCTIVGENFGATADIPSGTVIGGTTVYNGPLTVGWKVDEGYKYYDDGWGYSGFWAHGSGTYGTVSDCSGSGEVGTPWGVTATISGTNTAGDTVGCNYTGDFSRNYSTDITLSNLNGTCTVNVSNSPAITFNVDNDEWKATIDSYHDHPVQSPIPDYASLINVTLGG